MKNKLNGLVVLAKRNAARVGAGFTVMGLSGAAMAVDADPGLAAINALQTTASGYITAVFGVAVLVAGGFWGVDFMKKAFSKSK